NQKSSKKYFSNGAHFSPYLHIGTRNLKKTGIRGRFYLNRTIRKKDRKIFVRRS
ncbi:unnamed protein product, partial [Allacma fusca]